MTMTILVMEEMLLYALVAVVLVVHIAAGFTIMDWVMEVIFYNDLDNYNYQSSYFGPTKEKSYGGRRSGPTVMGANTCRTTKPR